MIQESERIAVENEYFEWMYHLVCNDKIQKRKISYRKLLRFLHSVVFVPKMERDENCRIHGLYFRHKFGYVAGYSNEYIDECFQGRACSVLEMMIALADKVESEITSNYLYGDRTSQWFWSMIISLGLNGMKDENFDERYCDAVIDSFLNRRYDYNGKGGLFTLEHPFNDMRYVDIWCQFMWYLNEVSMEEN